MKRLQRLAGRIWLFVLLLIAWQTLSGLRVLDPLFFPPPSRLVGTLGSLLASGEAGRALASTLLRVGAGFAAGVVLAMVASAAFTALPWLRRAANPLIAALYAAPRLTLLPMAMLVFGLNDAARIFLVALGTFLMVVLQVSDAVRAVSPVHVEMAVNYGASPAMVIRKIYLRACLPQIFTALRLAFGRALVLTISIELLSSDDGLGHMIWTSWQMFAIEKLFVGIALAGALGLLSQTLFRALERRVVPWGARRA